MRTELFDYRLPPELIAQEPAEPRDSSRLLVIGGPAKASGAGFLAHHAFRDLPEYLEPGDLLVLNRTRVLPARLCGRKRPTGGKVEVLLLRPAVGDQGAAGPEPGDPAALPAAGRSTSGLPPGVLAAWDRATVWEVLVRPGRRVRPGAELVFGGEGEVPVERAAGRTGPSGPGGPRLAARVLARTAAGGRVVSFRPLREGETFGEALEAVGEVPLPPYIRRTLADPERYQTIYASAPGSAAAPTAGLHLTSAIMDRLAAKGVDLAYVTLHIGLDTFRPVREGEVEAHVMHEEWYEVPPSTARAVEACRRRGGRVVACGTTVVRTLETAADPGRPGLVRPGGGETTLFIYPGFGFRVVDLLLTNFHLPRSTLLMLVAAFGGTERVLAAYREAARLRYRFYSFGDATLVFPAPEARARGPAGGGPEAGARELSGGVPATGPGESGRGQSERGETS